jgi:hypothetical protein
MTTPATIIYKNEFVPISDDQIASWKLYLSPGERLPTLVGNCPTCNDECEITLTDVVVQGGVQAGVEDDAPIAELTRQIICNCRTNHEWPTGVRAGCGRYWLATLRLEQDGSYRLTAEQDLHLLPAASALNDALATQDTRIQSAAEKWLGAVTAIYGLFSLTGVATANDALKGLSTPSKWLVAIALLLGLGAAATALVFGYRAAYGWPSAVKVDEKEALRDWYRQYRGFAENAARKLRIAIFFAFGSLAAIAMVMLLVWFLPRQGT